MRLEPQEAGSRGLDVRVNEAILRDPRRLKIGSNANMALICLQLFAIGAGRDGVIYADEYTKDDPYPGIPWVADETISKLKEYGLAEDYVDERGPGIRVTWLWQSTAEEREKARHQSRERSRRYRERSRANEEELSRLKAEDTPPVHATDSPYSVTRDAPVTNAGVGQDRTGKERQGEEKVRYSSGEGSQGTVPDSLGPSEWPPPPSKEIPPGLVG
ncbi:hypothetical protein EJ997_10500 [Flaviflexus ciconiae]|uniref:Uncharacterized protein n=1 Tax=Flaviflexus ciconiae TaxID=2496867 RepID=A0A3S9PZG5_9ACTO|nr:hypothetical protein [Flaviflexus ciconiae]AZQ77708.1 hypothetical protein EJ997_10500 [Flaviflexus ciconiae]